MKMLDFAQAAAVVPRAASTTLVVRDGPSGLEVLMVRRSLQASFMPGAYVFPGGAVDAADAAVTCDEDDATLLARIGDVTGVGAQARAYAVAALRECEEECNLRLGADRVAPGMACTSVLQPWSHWVTPVGPPKRFDTLFFIAPEPPGQTPKVDEGETTTLAWVHPAAALAERAQGGFPMEFATVKTVESLVGFATAAAILAEAASRRHLPPLHPRVVFGADGSFRGVLLPGQPGYEDAGRLPTA